MTSAFKDFVKFFFFGNYFYGICAVALSVEASLQQGFPLNNFWWYAFVFSSVVLFYTYAYLTESSPAAPNIRLQWYARNKKFIVASQVFFTAVAAVCIISFVSKNWEAVLESTALEGILFLFFPSVAALYYGINSERLSRYNLRKIG